jgi:hypothetical protein
LVLGEDVIFADISELGCAVAVCGFNADDLVIKSAFVHLLHIRGLEEGGSVLVYVHDRDVHRPTAMAKTEQTDMSFIRATYSF